MKVFCNCNSSWVVGLGYTNSGTNPQVQMNTIPKAFKYSLSFWCGKCTYWYWYDAHYENMVHDLRGMNQ
jgi:uncharacterized protein with PIN domain